MWNWVLAIIVGYAMPLLKQLMGVPKPPPTDPTALKAYSIQSEQNLGRIGAPMAVICGAPRRWPDLRSQSWFEYRNNDQLLHQWMSLGVGINVPVDLRVGDTDASTYGAEVQLCRPGESMTLFHPNVYSNTQVDGIELAYGSARNVEKVDSFTFAPAGFPNRIAYAGAGSNVFKNSYVGGSIVVSGTGANDGNYVATAVDEAGQTVDVAGGTLTPATGISADVTWATYNYNDTNIKVSLACNLAFSRSLSTLTCNPNPTYPDDITWALPGDQIVCTKWGPHPELAPGANMYTTFNVLGIADNTLIVFPRPDDAAGICNVSLVRRYHGPFVVCPQGAQVDRVAIDLAFPQGLIFITDIGAYLPMGVVFDLQWQPIDDNGALLDSWASFGSITISDKTHNPKRVTLEFGLPYACRAQLRLARIYHFTGDQSTDQTIDDVEWNGAKGYIVTAPGTDQSVDAVCSTLAVTLRATSGLAASGTDRKINCKVQAWKRVWDSITRAWLPEQATNNPVWSYLDILSGPYTAAGVAEPDANLDLDSLAALAADLDAAGIEFHGAFDRESTRLDACNAVLRTGRAASAYDWRAGRYTYSRDVPQVPKQMFTDMNSSSVSNYKLTLLDENAPTGVLVSYIEPISWEERQVGYPGDPETAGDAPKKVDLRNGWTSRQAAWAEANYQWNELILRNRSCTLGCELEAISLAYSDRILLQCRERKWGQAAEVRAQAGRTLTVWPPLDWSAAGPYFVYLRAPNGTPGGQIACTRGAGDNQLVLAADPDVEITGDANGEECTKLAFGVAGDEPVIAIVNTIGWSLGDAGGQQAQLGLVLDDAGIYADPGPAPPDPFAPSTGTTPSLAITGLSFEAIGGTFRASWDAIAAALLYELQWRYDGDILWTLAWRGTEPGAVWSIPGDRAVDVQVRAYGPGGAIGAWTEVDAMLISVPAWAGSRNPALVVNSTAAEHVAEARALAANALQPSDVVKGYVKATLAGTAGQKSLRLCVDADSSGSLLAQFDAGVTGHVQARFRFMVAASGNVHASYSTADEGTTANWLEQAGNATVNLVTTAVNLQTRAWVANAADSITIDSIEWELTRAMP